MHKINALSDSAGLTEGFPDLGDKTKTEKTLRFHSQRAAQGTATCRLQQQQQLISAASESAVVQMTE